MAIRACYSSAAAQGRDPPLPRNTVLTVAAMTIEEEENVRAAARASLADIIDDVGTTSCTTLPPPPPNYSISCIEID